MIKKLAISLLCFLSLAPVVVSAQDSQPQSWKFQKDQDNKCVARNVANPSLELMAQKLTITTKETSDLKTFQVSINEQVVMPMSRVNLTDTACKCVRIRNMSALAFDDLNTLVKAVAQEAKPGDHILVMSNGGFGGIHQKILERLA